MMIDEEYKCAYSADSIACSICVFNSRETLEMVFKIDHFPTLLVIEKKVKEKMIIYPDFITGELTETFLSFMKAKREELCLEKEVKECSGTNRRRRI